MTASFSAAWLQSEPRALELLPDRYRHPAARGEAVEQAARRRVPPELIDALRRQNARYAPSPAREENLALLERPGTTVVVTGQQVGLFLGPLYTLYKAASAIRDARTLREETGRPCVPLFWLQTEDHDLPEVDHCDVPRSTGEPLRIALALPDAASARIPVAHQRLGPSVTAALATLRAELGAHPHAAEHLGQLERAYTPDATLPEAFAQVAAELFADDGLVLLDPRDPAIAALARPMHRRVVEDARAIADALLQRCQALRHAGFTEQVHVRPASPLCFYSPDGIDGPRYRLDAGPADELELVGAPEARSVARATLLSQLETDPLRFTTSALLRPILQDTLLPTAAYVGGPGEIAYFAQLAPLYQHMNVPMPLVAPRARFRLLDDRARGLLEKLGLTAEQACGSPASLQQLVAQSALQAGFEAPREVEARLLATFTPELTRFGQQLRALDPGLDRAVSKTHETARDAVSKLVAKYERALAQRDQVRLERVERLRALLLPNGAPQERVHSMSYYACRFGAKALVREILGAVRPFSGELIELTL